MLVPGVREKAVRLTFGIKGANKKVRNNKSPFKGKDTVFFLTRDLSADAPADSKEYKGEVNRGNRKKRVALNNKVFFVLYNLFLFPGPYVLWESPVSAAPCLLHGSGCCVCTLCPLAGLSPSPPAPHVQERSEGVRMPRGRKQKGVILTKCGGCVPQAQV